MFRFRAPSNIYIPFFLVIGITLVGTVGFMSVEGYELGEALYMTIITVSTVGYGEVKPLSEAGRLFTSFLIIFTFGTFAYTLSTITTFIMGGEYKHYFNRLRLEKKIELLDQHVLVCGYGRVGKMAARSLAKHQVPYVVLEIDDEKLDSLGQKGNIMYMKGNATSDEILLKAGIERASAVITTMPDDADNLYTVLTAREMNSKLTIITRASKPESVKKLRIAGATNVIMPDSVGGVHMASLVVNPDVQEFLDQIAIQGEADVNLEEVILGELSSSFPFKTLKDLRQNINVEVNIIGLKSVSGEYAVNPDPDTPILSHSKFFVLGNPTQITKFGEVLRATSGMST